MTFFLWNFNSPYAVCFYIFLDGTETHILYTQAPLYIALSICYRINNYFFSEVLISIKFDNYIAAIIKYYGLYKYTHVFQTENFQ